MNHSDIYGIIGIVSTFILIIIGIPAYRYYKTIMPSSKINKSANMEFRKFIQELFQKLSNPTLYDGLRHCGPNNLTPFSLPNQVTDIELINKVQSINHKVEAYNVSLGKLLDVLDRYQLGYALLDKNINTSEFTAQVRLPFVNLDRAYNELKKAVNEITS